MRLRTWWSAGLVADDHEPFDEVRPRAETGRSDPGLRVVVASFRGWETLMGRTMPTECDHGVVVDWGDFGPEDEEAPRCVDCDQEKIVGKLVGREVRADGTEVASFRIVNGTVPGGPSGMGVRYVLVGVTPDHPFWDRPDA